MKRKLRKTCVIHLCVVYLYHQGNVITNKLKINIMKTLTKNIELNESNTVTAEAADVFFNMLLEVSVLEEDVKKLHNLDKEAAKAEYKSEKYYTTQKTLAIAKETFKKNHGEEKLILFVMYSTLKNRIAFVCQDKKTTRAYKINKMNKETREY